MPDDLEKSTVQELTELDLGAAPDEAAVQRGIAKVMDVLGAEQRKADNVDGPDGLFARFKERLTGMRAVTKTGQMNDTFSAWDALPLLMSDSLWNDTNFTNALGHTCVLLAAAQDPEKVSAWLADSEFIEGVKVVLRDLYEKRGKLQRGEAYQGWQTFPPIDKEVLKRYRTGFCQRSLVIINKLISVFEFIVRASQGEAQPNEIISQPRLLPATVAPIVSSPVEAEGNAIVDATAALAKFRIFIAAGRTGDILILDPELTPEGGRGHAQLLRSYNDLPRIANRELEEFFRREVHRLAEALQGKERVTIDKTLYDALSEMAQAKRTRLANLLTIITGQAVLREGLTFRIVSEAELREMGIGRETGIRN